MNLHPGRLALLGVLSFRLLAAGAAEAAPFPSARIAPTALNVRPTPSLHGDAWGRVAANEPFTVLAVTPGADCPGEGWGQVSVGGYVCLSTAAPTNEAPTALPRLMVFDAPDPDEYSEYVRTGTYQKSQHSPSVPFVYGKRWRRWHGHLWSTPAAWLAGEPPGDQLELHHTYSFVSALDTPKGRLFVRKDGRVVPSSEVFLYPVTDFRGRDLVQAPVPDGAAAAWVVGWKGAAVRAEAKAGSPILATLAYHLPVVVRPVPTDARWWSVDDALGTGTPGFVQDSELQRWVPAGAPAEVLPGETWVDIDLREQTLALVVDDHAVFVTLVSAGVVGKETPKGTFRIYDKATSNDMKSLEGSDEPYHVEEVPWVMHFKPRYAMHAAFWHWGFGHPASHGCVNLSPLDARYVFDHVSPALPLGFDQVSVTKAAPGTVVRIR